MPSERPADWPGAEQWVPERHTVQALAAALGECRGCNLYRDATQAVPGSGPPEAAMLLLGEQPGDHEDQEGEPFVGPAGRLLDRALADAGIDPGAPFRTNAVKHFRFERRGSNRLHKSPARWQVARCEPWLLAELDAVRPRTVVLLGATAGQAVYGSGFRIGERRGRVLKWPESLGRHRPEVVAATIHPSAVLRSRERDAMYAGLVADLRVASSS